jgi:signal transduction histidine kinase
MRLKSIHLRLTLSFAMIALVTAAVLGAVLLAVLQSYYGNLEESNLRANAQTIGGMVTAMMAGGASPDAVQSQIEILAPEIQRRIQVYGPDEQLLYDSGPLQGINARLATNMQAFPVSDATQSTAAPGPTQVAGSGPELSANILAGGAQSQLRQVEPLRDPRNNTQLGSVVLSEGPAYGSAISASIVWGWALASAIAILLAGLVGWTLSRRISAPVLALTEATTRMAHGDLGSRARVESHDELAQLARSFNDMAHQVETTITALRRFAADAAHELRTPLTALRTNLDLALEEKDPTEREVFVARAQAMVGRLDELNSNLLDLSRLEAAVPGIRVAAVDWTGLLRARSERYASRAEQAGLAYAAKWPPTPIVIYADASQIARAMDDLVDNACKFTPPNGSVRVALSQRDGQTIFSVSDTGIGIPADDRPQLFNRFHRGRNTTAYPGSGLGLAIVNAIVTAHAGQVEGHSAGEGKGSTFWFSLPAVTPDKPTTHLG